MKCLAVVSLFALLTPSAFAESVASIKVSFVLDNNRILVRGTVSSKGQQGQEVRAWVDTGTADLWITEKLVKQLGLKRLSPDADTPFGKLFNVQAPDAIEIAGVVLKIPPSINVVGFEAPSIGLGVPADINIPAPLLAQTDLKIDYAHSWLSVDVGDSQRHTGIEVPLQIDKSTSTIQIPVELGGKIYQATLDTGATYSYIEPQVIGSLMTAHPTWAHLKGAVGAANMWGWPEEESAEIMRIPKVKWGPLKLVQLGVEQAPPQWTAPNPSNVGSIGGNVLKHSVVEIDYKDAVAYFDQAEYADDDQFDMVGLTLRPQSDGQFVVLGQASTDGKPFSDEIEPNDHLIAIGGLQVIGMSMGNVIKALSGQVGDVKHLVLERGGKRYNVDATVRQLFPSMPASQQ